MVKPLTGAGYKDNNDFGRRGIPCWHPWPREAPTSGRVQTLFAGLSKPRREARKPGELAPAAAKRDRRYQLRMTLYKTVTRLRLLSRKNGVIGLAGRRIHVSKVLRHRRGPAAGTLTYLEPNHRDGTYTLRERPSLRSAGL